LVQSGLIFVGAGVGGLMRYWAGGLIQLLAGPTFPLGTMVVNVTGCLAMGFLATAWTGPVLIREEYRAGMLVGVLGGYTTFSTFGRETMELARDGEWIRVGVYVLGTVALSLVGVWLGAALANRMYGGGAP
jgi:CrcB protein